MKVLGSLLLSWALLVPAELKDLRDITGIENVPARAERTLSWWWWLVLALGGMAVIGVALITRNRKRSARATLEQRALYELDRLRALRLPERGKVADFHTLLANVVRNYLEKRHGLPARRMTTQELETLIEQAEALSPDQKAWLGDFCRRCDLAKFAELEVSAQECHALLDQARQFIEGVTMVSPADKTSAPR